MAATAAVEAQGAGREADGSVKQKTEAVRLTREELYRQVWQTPIVKLAAELGLSDVGLAKICERLDVPRPPRGYWQKRANGKRVYRPTLRQSARALPFVDIAPTPDPPAPAPEPSAFAPELSAFAPQAEPDHHAKGHADHRVDHHDELRWRSVISYARKWREFDEVNRLLDALEAVGWDPKWLSWARHQAALRSPLDEFGRKLFAALDRVGTARDSLFDD